MFLVSPMEKVPLGDAGVYALLGYAMDLDWMKIIDFAPFAALVGYDEMVQDTADYRLLEQRIIPQPITIPMVAQEGNMTTHISFGQMAFLF